tara:strand:+ start:84 stop:527 length:444 start_codon:yes stop_codon:yes gene_type:complete
MEKTNYLKLYQESIDKNIEDMNNLIHYNQFTNQEIRRLEKKNKFLYKDLTLFKEKSKKLEIENSSLAYELEGLREENYSMKSRSKKRKRDNLEILDDNDKWLTTFKRKKPKKYKYMKIENRNRHIIKIFENLNNIKDIINIFEKKNK